MSTVFTRFEKNYEIESSTTRLLVFVRGKMRRCCPTPEYMRRMPFAYALQESEVPNDPTVHLACPPPWWFFAIECCTFTGGPWVLSEELGGAEGIISEQ